VETSHLPTEFALTPSVILVVALTATVVPEQIAIKMVVALLAPRTAIVYPMTDLTQWDPTLFALLVFAVTRMFALRTRLITPTVKPTLAVTTAKLMELARLAVQTLTAEPSMEVLTLANLLAKLMELAVLA